MAAPKPGFPSGLITKAVQEGLTATESLRIYRELGGSVRTQTWYRLYGQAKLALDTRAEEGGRPLHLRPVAGEINPMTTRTATGYIQQVQVLMKDRETGEVITREFSQRGPGVTSRTAAIENAISTFGDFSDQYDFQILGGIYTGTYQLIPEG